MPLLEVELKLKVDDLSGIALRLKEAGAVKLAEEEQVDVYFQHPCRDFAETDEALRLRVSGGSARITYKGPRLSSEAKVRREVEVGVSDPERAGEILEALGFTRVAVIRKRRSVYRLGDVNVYLDEVEGLGSFVEIEADPGTRDPLTRVREVARTLGLDPGKAILKSYLELCLERARRGGGLGNPPSSQPARGRLGGEGHPTE